jgi:hypothetical protein
MNDTQQMSGILAAVFGFYAVFLLVILAAVIVPLWFICKKAGFSPWLSLLIIIPFGGLVLLYVLAFAEWKVVPAPHLAFQTPLPPPPPQQPPLPPQV